MRLEPNAPYELRGQVYTVSGDGVGVYVRLYGRRGETLQRTSAQRRKSFRAVGGKPYGQWQPFTIRFRTTPQTRYARVWLHTFSASRSEVYVDDLDLAAVDPSKAPKP